MIFVIELACFAGLLCFLHSQRQRLGLAPIYVLIGLFEAFLFFIGRDGTPIEVTLFFGQKVSFAYSLLLPLMLLAILLVYIIDGTREARRFLIAFLLLYVIHGVIDVLISYHAHHPPPGTAFGGKSPIVVYSMLQRFASMCAFFADAIVLVILFQWITNLFPKIGKTIPLYVCFFCAMLIDGVVFPLIYTGTLQGPEWHNTVGKCIVGLIAGGPFAVYLRLAWRREHALRASGSQRGTFDIIDVRYRVREAERKLREKQEQFLMVKESFARYVPPAIVDAMVHDPGRFKLGGEVLDVAVLFSDIRAYSTLSEKLEPTDPIKLLNRYFEHVTEVIFAHGGMINEFEGDGILAVFGAPVPIDRHAERGLRAALGMLRAVDEFNEICEADGTAEMWKEAGWDRLAIRIGLHAGSVVAGNIGTTQRLKYAVIGDTVNTASRIEGLNKILETELLVSQEVLSRIKNHQLYEFVDMGTHEVKGKGKEVHVFTPSDELRLRSFGPLGMPSLSQLAFHVPEDELEAGGAAPEE